MLGLAILIFGALGDLFRSRVALETEILALRQQIIVLRRGKPSRLPFSASDRWILGWICRLFPNARDALAVVRPETVLRWLTQACGWDRAPLYLIRDRDACYGNIFVRRVRSLGIRDHRRQHAHPGRTVLLSA